MKSVSAVTFTFDENVPFQELSEALHSTWVRQGKPSAVCLYCNDAGRDRLNQMFNPIRFVASTNEAESITTDFGTMPLVRYEGDHPLYLVLEYAE